MEQGSHCLKSQKASSCIILKIIYKKVLKVTSLSICVLMKVGLRPAPAKVPHEIVQP